LRLLKPGLDFLSLVARGPLRRSRTTGKSTRPTEEVTRIVDAAEIANNIPQIRKRRGFFVTLTAQRSSARCITPQGTI
jgi:hypothetical protein